MLICDLFLYDLQEENFGDEVFNRVERGFCCGLQSSDPANRQKFFKLYSSRIKQDLFDRLHYIIQKQDWDFLSHTFWLKHAVALLFDCLHMNDPITLAYNSAHVPPLFNYKDSLVLHAIPHHHSGAQSSKGKEGTGASGEVANTGDKNDGADTAPVEQKGEGAGSDTSKPAPSGSAAKTSCGRKTPVKPAPVLDIDLPESLRNTLTSHLEFLADQSVLKSEALVNCLMEQVQTDPLVAHHLWVLLFPIVWTSLLKEQQTGLAKPIINLLSKEHHLRQAFLRPTVGQTLLDGISMSQPQPKIPAEMIKYMGRHFHAWHTAISMLESHVGLFPTDMRCFDAVCDLYTALGEDDMRCGLWQRRAASEETKTAIALQQHGYIADAQNVYLEMMSRGVSSGVKGVTKSEMVLWHDQYLACCTELNQWDTIADYAKSTDNSALQLEAAAKQHDWANLRQMAVPKAQVEEGPEFTLIKGQTQLADMNILDIDKLCKSILNQCVIRWWQMPESSPWSYAPVLHTFHRAVELLESWRVMVEISMQGGSGSQYQDLKDIADTWKLRTPNEWEPIRWWSDILTWRNQVYNLTIRHFTSLQSSHPNLHQMGYRDKAWSVNRLGYVARLHHLPEACVHIINTQYGFNAMEVQEAFVKVQEQAKAYMLRPSEHLHGLNLINSTNMDYFQPTHQAEMICLKAQFHHLLKEEKPAENTFSEALTLWHGCPDAWINFGRFCDDRYMASVNAQHVSVQTKDSVWLEYAAACYTQGIRLSGVEARNLVPRLLHLLMLDVNGAEIVGRQLMQLAGELPTWVWLPWVPQLITSLQRPETQVARRILVTAAMQHPQYMYWYIRPVLMHLKEAALNAVKAAKEKNAAKSNVKKGEKDGATKDDADGGKGASVKSEDQEMTDADASAKPSVSADPVKKEEEGQQQQQQLPMEKPMEVIAYDNAKDVMDTLRAKTTPALQSLDVLIAELSSKFGTRTDERLLAVVHTLQYRSYKYPDHPSKPVPETLRRELASVCKACGGSARGEEGNAASSTASGGSWVDWAKYQREFARDLDPEGEDPPKTLGELTSRLKGWRIMMQSMIEDMHPSTLRLEEQAPTLVEMPFEEVELPCQAPPCPDGPDPIFIDRISSDITVVRRACTSSRRIAVYGSDGQIRHFLLSGPQSSGVSGSGEERVGQLLRAANALLASHPESRRRGLAFTAPRSHVLYPNTRIVEDDPSSCLYVDAYETYCTRYARDADAPIVQFKDTVNRVIAEAAAAAAAAASADVPAGGGGGEGGGDSADPAAAASKPASAPSATEIEHKARRTAFDEICSPQQITENIFSQYMYKTVVENSRYMWAMKRQFSLSVALSAVACFVLRLTGRAPSKLVISRAKGELTHLELTVVYNDRLQMDIFGESVPFRLTRNMSAFIGAHGFDGTLIAAAVAAAMGLQQEKTYLPSLLALFLRDDILTFAQRRLNVKSIAGLTLQPHQIEAAILYNVTGALTRLEKVGPKDSVTPLTIGQGNAVQVANPQNGMRELVLAATSPTNLCKMDPAWMPWL